MSDDEIDDPLKGFPPNDPSALLERLDEASLEDFTVPDEPSLSPAPRSRQEIDGFVDQVLTEELSRLNGGAAKKKG
jgi:hypothetical protein